MSEGIRQNLENLKKVEADPETLDKLGIRKQYEDQIKKYV